MSAATRKKLSVITGRGVSYSNPLYTGTGGIAPFDQHFLMWEAVPVSTTTVVIHKGQFVTDVIDASRKKLA